MAQHNLAHYLQAYDQLTEDFIDTFASFTKAEYNRPIAEGKWSPGGYAEHVLKSERAFGRILRGPMAPAPAGRGADDLCARIDVGLRETTTAYEAPASVRPPEGTRYSAAEQLDAFVDGRAEVRTAVEFAPDPGAVAKAYAHFLFGELTVTEWLYFQAMHGERHRLQVAAARR